MRFSEIVSLIAKRYGISAAIAAETAKQVLSDRDFETLAEIEAYLAETEEKT